MTNSKRLITVRTTASKIAVLACFASTGLSMTGIANAQNDALGNETAEEALVADKVIVTARRKDENLQDVPLSVTVFDADSLEAKNISNIRDLNTQVPNITIGAAGGFGGATSSIFMRGIGQDRSASVAEPGVGIYVDGVFLGQADGGLLDLVDVERVEVLKGPQGTLFGKNAIGGLLHYISKKPEQDYFGDVKFTTGSFNRLDVEGAVNIPINDKVAVRVSALSKNRDGHVEDIFDPLNPVDVGDIGTRAGRFQLRLQPNDQWDINFSADYTKMDNNGTPSSTIAGNPDAFPALVFDGAGPPIAVDTLGNLFPDSVPVPTGDLYTTRLSANTSTDFEGYGLNLTTEYEISENATLKSITAYRSFDSVYVVDFDASAGVLRDETVTRTHNQFQQELQILGTVLDDQISYVAGAFLFSKNPVDNRVQRRETLGGENLLNFDIETESYALYGEVENNFTDQFSLAAGVRGTWEEGMINAERNGTAGSTSEEWDSFDYRITGRYRPNESTMLYASVSTGFKSGGFNDRDPNPAEEFDGLVPFDPEEATSYEVGLKTGSADGRFTLNLAGFVTEYTNLQLPQILPGFDDVVVGNIGEAQIDGIEADFFYEFTENFRVNGAVGWMDARITDGRTADGTENSEQPTGTQLGRSPDLSYSIGGEFINDLDSGATLSTRADWGWKGDHRTLSPVTNGVMQDAYGLLSGRITYTTASGDISVSLFGTNLTDEEYLVGGLDLFDTPFGTTTVEVGRPSEWGLQLGVKF